MNLNPMLLGFNLVFTLCIVFPAILFLGFYLTWKLRGVQVTFLKASFCSLLNKEAQSEGNISRFGAISAVLAGNFGTGNISGMAVAIASGGPGALVWMWIMAFFGSVIQYSSCILGVQYRQKTKEGEYVGGPMYYLQHGLGLRKCACLFAFFVICAAFSVGNLAQMNSIILPLEKLGLNPLYCSLVFVALVGVVILGGIKRLAHIASYVVPIKAFIYLAAAFLIIGLHSDQVIPAFKLMFSHAFDFSSLVGGTLGFGAFQAIKTGFDRGLFATDAGTGIAPILQSGARSKNPVVDGISTLIAPLMVMIVCTATGLVLIVTGAWQESGLQSTNMVTHAFSEGLNSPLGGYTVMVALLLFAYTTIIAWCYCGEKAVEYFFGTKGKTTFRIAYILFIPVGTLIHVDLIWLLADIFISLMLIMNLVGVAGLSSSVIRATDHYRNSGYSDIYEHS